MRGDEQKRNEGVKKEEDMGESLGEYDERESRRMKEVREEGVSAHAI